MSSGFLLATALAEALRRPYHRGDMEVTLRYLIKKEKIGAYRVMLKSNFDTACWVPPVGKRDSHSIYYGDRMLERTIDFFLKKVSITLPEAAELKDNILKRRQAEADAKAAKLAATGKPAPTAKIKTKVSKTELLNERLLCLKNSLSPTQWDEFIDLTVRAVAAFGRHEREHARNTPQDLKQTTRELRMFGIPFHIFNWFEDARIEHISRQTLGTPFHWLEFESLTELKAHPISLFARRIQLEGAVDGEALDHEDENLVEMAETIAGFYDRAIVCPTAEHLYPVMKEFMDVFKDFFKKPEKPESGEGEGEGGEGSGAPSGDPEEGEGGSGSAEENAGEQAGDLSTAAEAADKGDEFFDEFEKDAEVIGGTDEEGKAAEERAKAALKGEEKSAPPKGAGAKSQGIPESIEPQESGGRAKTGHFLATNPGKLDAVYAARVDNLTTMLMRMFKTHTLPAATESPGKRMSGRHLARGEIMYVHKKVFGGKGKRKYSIVYDCSGSMSGRPDREGKLLLLALNNLAKRGYLQGHLVLSGWVDGRPGWLSYPFPVAEEVILRINPSHSSEGLQASLADNLANIKGMDDVFVMTDACICDAPLNRDFFAKHRVWPVGLYVGDESAASQMEKHFPQNIIRDTIEQVVEAMLIRNRRTVG